MAFKKYALGIAVAAVTACTGFSGATAESASGSVVETGISTPSGSVTSSGTVRKRTNVRTVRNAASAGSTASGTAVPGTSGSASMEKYSTDAVTVTSPSAGLAAALWGLGAAFEILWLTVTLFFGFCLYKIATKLGEPYAWLWFIPYVQTYTFVKCGGKSGWWVLWITLGFVAFFIPGLVLTLVVMHGISKRYGRGAGTTALFFFFPYVMLPALAFSEPLVARGNSGGVGYAPEYASNAHGAPTPTAVPVASPVPASSVNSIFAPEAPEPAASEVPSETPVPTAAADAFAPAPATEPGAVEPNPIAKEAEKIVDEGPGFKLPGA